MSNDTDERLIETQVVVQPGPNCEQPGIRGAVHSSMQRVFSILLRNDMKKEEIVAILEKVSFEDDPVQVLSLWPERTRIEFPLNEGPVNFSVMNDGGVSVRWGVTIKPKKGDAYIYNRDVKTAEKASLHASGEQHVAISDKTAIRVGASGRFGPRWTEPEFNVGAVPTLSILFPPWGVTDMRPKRLAKGNGELLIVGHLTKIVIVGFFITDPETKLQLNTPHFVLGKLPLRPGKVLNIVVWKEPDNGLKTMLRASLKRVPIPLADTDDTVISFQGIRAPHSAYMVAVPVSAIS